MNSETKKIYCFGEILWDIIIGQKYPGGAPLNAAYHLAKLEADVALISRIGKDSAGEELKRLLERWKINSDCLQVGSKQATGRVQANVLAGGEVVYSIEPEVAWDYIQQDAAVLEAVRQSDCFIYGSLAARSLTTRETLFALLKEAKFKVFDMNLRAPHYDENSLERLLMEADLVKLNQDELSQVNTCFALARSTKEENVLTALMNRFAIPEIILSKGKDGAVYFSKRTFIHRASPAVELQDTVGCGDAFLAAFLGSYLQEEGLELALEKAVAMGAFIASKKGGCPAYDLEEFEGFYAKSLDGLTDEADPKRFQHE